MKSSILNSISISLSWLVLSTATTFGAGSPAAISGDYLEVRSCDVYTGPCFANSEMNLAGKEGMLFWSVRQGTWDGAKLDGLAVMAVVTTDATLGDVEHQPRSGNAVLIVDSKADAKQKEALAAFARSMGGKLIGNVVNVKSAPIEASLATCSKLGCASVKAGDLAEISTSCLGNKHDVCGNEETYYPPLSKVNGAYPVFTELAAFRAPDLGCTWQITGKRSAFLASFESAPAAIHNGDVALAH